MKRFHKITEGLYRGSAPSPNEVRHMKKYLGINKIVSFDKATGEIIHPVCKELQIEHIMLPLNGRRAPLIEFLNKDLWTLLMDNGPTFIHCSEGKDRTGFVAAMFKCLYMDWDYDQAMEEAKSLGFGVGVNPFIIGLYSNILKKICKEKEIKDNMEEVEDLETIVSNQRSYAEKGDGRGSYLDQATQGSWAPQISRTRQYPYDSTYNSINDQSPTRDNWNHEISPYRDGGGVEMPLVGLYDMNAGVRGFGPAEPFGGFITS
jgi:protein tyrosine/serine phosphatase